MANLNLQDSSNIKVVQSGSDISLDLTTTGIIGNLSNLTTSNKSSLVSAINEIDESSVDSYSFPSGAGDGYIKYKNGFMIQWKNASTTTSVIVWVSPIYYSDYSFGDWDIPFTNLYSWNVACNQTQFWCASGNISTTSAGTIRVFRPNNSNLTVGVTIIAFGTWK